MGTADVRFVLLEVSTGRLCVVASIHRHLLRSTYFGTHWRGDNCPPGQAALLAKVLPGPSFVFQELDRQRDYVDITVDTAVHGDAVRQVAYFPETETVVTCSRDPSATLVIRHVAARRTPYIFKLARVGITIQPDVMVQFLVTEGHIHLAVCRFSYILLGSAT